VALSAIALRVDFDNNAVRIVDLSAGTVARCIETQHCASLRLATGAAAICTSRPTVANTVATSTTRDNLAFRRHGNGFARARRATQWVPRGLVFFAANASTPGSLVTLTEWSHRSDIESRNERVTLLGVCRVPGYANGSSTDARFNRLRNGCARAMLSWLTASTTRSDALPRMGRDDLCRDGSAGMVDGPIDSAMFNNPDVAVDAQGICSSATREITDSSVHNGQVRTLAVRRASYADVPNERSFLCSGRARRVADGTVIYLRTQRRYPGPYHRIRVITCPVSTEGRSPVAGDSWLRFTPSVEPRRHHGVTTARALQHLAVVDREWSVAITTIGGSKELVG